MLKRLNIYFFIYSPREKVKWTIHENFQNITIHRMIIKLIKLEF